MGFYDDVRQAVRTRKNDKRRAKEVSETTKRGYTRKVEQRYDPEKKKR